MVAEVVEELKLATTAKWVASQIEYFKENFGMRYPKVFMENACLTYCELLTSS